MADRAILLTYRDYCELPDDGRRYEIHDGELSVTPAPNPRHQRLVGAIYRILFAHVRSRGLGEVLLSPIDVSLTDIAIVEPDVVYLERARAGAVSSRRQTTQASSLRTLPGALLLDGGRGGTNGGGACAGPGGVRAGRAGGRRGACGAAVARRSGARRGHPLARRGGRGLELGPLAGGRADLGLDATPHVEVARHLDPAGLGRRHEVVQDPVRHVLVERALVPARPHVELERLELDQVLVGHVADADRREVGLAGPGAEASELRHGHRHLVVAVRVRVRHDLERLRRRTTHARVIAARAQRLVSPMPTATAALASKRSSVSGSPVTRAAASTPKIGWVRKNPESALCR